MVSQCHAYLQPHKTLFKESSEDKVSYLFNKSYGALINIS